MSEASLSIGKQRIGALKKRTCRENGFKHAYAVECENRLRVGVHANRKYARNSFGTKNRQGSWGEGLGGHAKLFMLGSSPIFEVLSGPPSGLT